MVLPYLHFGGDCEEAFQLYVKAFDGTFRSLSRHGNDPANKVMHAEVMLTATGAVAGSDSLGPEAKPNFEILVHLESRERVETVLSRLSEGGTVVQPFTAFPPPDDAGGGATLIDKYGFTWILTASV